MIIRDYIANTASPFYDAENVLSSYAPSFLKDDNNQFALTQIVNALHGFRRLTVSMDEVKNACMVLYTIKEYEYNKLWNTLTLEYNPIQNYDMVEEGKDTNTGTDTTTVDYGESVNKEDIASVSDTHTTGSGKDTSTLSVAPFNVSGYAPKEKNENEIGEKINTDVYGKRLNTYTNGKKTDESVLKHGKIVEHKLRRIGNIGVTTSQQMIQSERELAMFELWRQIASDITNFITSGVMDYDCATLPEHDR